MSVEYGVMLAYVAGIIFLYILGRMLLVPMKVVVKLITNTLLGGIALLSINFVGNMFGFHIPLNIVNSLVTGFLGIPGVLLLVALKVVFNG